MAKFNGQLKGEKAKEEWFSKLREEAKIKLPKAGASFEVKLPKDKLDGAFLSCLDGSGSLTLNGKKVSKIKVYNGDISLPKNFNLTFIVSRTKDANCRLKANITSKK